ncbi:nucleotidyltransferase family protein [Bosea vaviloviae]|uniref:Nucleotidyltransferase n=1 Tax=Bosea vaviloviae TaxID=1526658 RepID=A0A1D7UCQ1_9HYPH|nr:nucleotidyltransferase family protein [Bosea vaviloviae]AOO85104.1 hypothetical protein BHK69_30890 [Bosea vaviloviae]
MTERGATEFLLWIARSGEEGAHIGWRDLDDARLFELAKKHRVVGRALACLQREDAHRRHASLVELLSEEFVRIKTAARLQSEVTESFLSVARQAGGQFVLIKGNTVFDLLGGEFRLRKTSDIDMISSKPDALHSHLLDLGYVHSWKASSHEEINIRYQGTLVDVHKYFPLFRMTRGERAIPAPINSQAFGLNLRTNNLELVALGVDEIIEGSIYIPHIDGHPILRPAPALAAFITAMHLYGDFVRAYPALMRFRPLVRLFELLELDELIGHVDFDPVKFRVYVDSHGVRNEMVQVARIMAQVTGNRRLFELLGAPYYNGNEYELFVAFGFSVSREYDVTDLLIRPLGLCGLLSGEAIETLVFEDRSVTPLVGGNSAVKPTYWGEKNFPAIISVCRQERMLEFTIEYLESQLPSPYISITLGQDYYRIFPECRGRETSTMVNSAHEIQAMEVCLGALMQKVRVCIEAGMGHRGEEMLDATLTLGNVSGATMDLGLFVPYRCVLPPQFDQQGTPRRSALP